MEEFGDSSPDETADEMIAGIRALRREGCSAAKGARKEENMKVKSTSSSPDETRLDKLAAEQRVRPIEDFDAFMEETEDIWPEDENVDDFIEAVRRWRHEGEERKLP
jgi:hypothetical protein